MSFILEDVSFTYQKNMMFSQEALRGLNFSIKEGEILGIVGAAGSGKSTLLQLLNGLLKAEKGRVTYNNRDLATLNRRELVKLRQQVGMVFQYPEQQIFAERVYEEIAFGPRNNELDDKEVDRRVREAMSQVGLDFADYSQRPTTALSSGEKRRVALAGILSLKPRHLLLDEPTAGLDHEGRQSIINCLKELNQQNNTTIVFVTHHLSHLMAICQRLIVLDKGRIVLDTPVSNLLRQYSELKEIGIELPPHLEVSYRLQQCGWDLDTRDISLEAIARQIALRYISKQEEPCSGI